MKVVKVIYPSPSLFYISTLKYVFDFDLSSFQGLDVVAEPFIPHCLIAVNF